MLPLCHHCGEDITEGEERETDAEENIYHRTCKNTEIPRCQEAVERFIDLYSPSTNVLYSGVHVHYLYGTATKQDRKAVTRRKKKEKREEKIEEIVRKISALRNSNSGFLLIQLVGMDESDKFIFGALDELLDDKLNRLIEDGNLFSNVFTKTRLSMHDGMNNYHDLVVLYVEASPFITTAEFKTKISLDEGIENPSPLTVFKFIKNKETFKEIYPEMALEDLESVIENRSLQVKSIKDEAQDMTADELSDYIINGLRLTEYVSAFSKNSEGGVYLVGMREKEKSFKTKDKDYMSKVLYIHGVTLADKTKTIDGVVDKVKHNILVCDYDGNGIEDSDIVKVDVVPCPGSAEALHRFIIRVFVRSVNGIVFYDKSGPVAYEISHHDTTLREPSVSRIALDKWFRIVHKMELF